MCINNTPIKYMCINNTPINCITSILDWFNNDFLYLFEEECNLEDECTLKDECNLKDLEIYEDYNWDLI
mgnify:CR=1 FL=1